jgi:DNA-binding NtrC family response regulator
MVSPNVLIVSPILDVQQALAGVLAKFGLLSLVASTASEADAILNAHTILLIFCSDELPRGDIENVIRQRSFESNRVPTVVVSRLDDWDRFIRFLRDGALDYVLFPLNEVEIERVLRNALSLVDLRKVRQLAAI